VRGESRRLSELATALRGLSVDLLGTGGAARAIVTGLRDAGGRVTIYGRSRERTRGLADALGATPAAWDQRTARNGSILINCTNVGMTPAADTSPMPAEALRGCALVFDVIYNPLTTKLLRDAAAAGIATLGGLDMFLRQAGRQFVLWTGRTPDLDAARPHLTAALTSSPPTTDVLQTADVLPTPLPPGGRGQGEGAPREPTSKSTPTATAGQCSPRPSIALIGYRGCGKTAVGRLLADLLGLPHVDTDAEIVARAGRSIADIFAVEGEARFRDYEAAVITSLAAHPSVISVGGGAVLDPQNINRLRSLGTVIWLTAPPEELWARISADLTSSCSRPPLTTLEGVEEVRKVLAARSALYAAAADMVVDTAGKTADAVAREITLVTDRMPTPAARMPGHVASVPGHAPFGPLSSRERGWGEGAEAKEPR